MNVQIIVSVLIATIPAILCSKIIFVGMPIYSHINPMAILADVLIERGHEVWITALPDLEEKLRLNKRSIKRVPFTSLQSQMKVMRERMDNSSREILTTGTSPLPIDMINKMVVTIITDQGFLSTMEKEKFDLAIISSIPIVSMLHIIPYKFDVPFIDFGIMCNHFQWRIPFSPAFVPLRLLSLTDKMTFLERLANTLVIGAWAVYDPFSYRNAVAMFAPEKPFISLPEIIRKSSLHIVETNDLLTYPFPTMPNVIKVTSLSPRSSAKIPKEYLDFIQKSKNGVVVVSFGSQFPTMESPVLTKLVNALKKTEYDYIIKGNFTKGSDRIMVSNWIPQSALLGHRKIKLFITHCGANGLGEAITNGVPMLGLPLFAEQEANGHQMQSRGYGLSMSMFHATMDEITDAVNEIIINPSYKQKVVKASAILNEFEQRKNSSLEAVFWIEHVMKYGGDHLRSSGVDMPLYQYLLLDVIAVVILVIVIVITVLYVCIRACFRRCCRQKSKRKQQ